MQSQHQPAPSMKQQSSMSPLLLLFKHLSHGACIVLVRLPTSLFLSLSVDPFYFDQLYGPHDV